MATRNWERIGFIVVSLVFSAHTILAQSQERYFFAEAHLGTIVELTLYAPDENVANDAARSAYARVKELDQIFSDYKSDSEVMKLCEQAGSGSRIGVSSELFHVLKRAIEVSKQTDGAFDVTVGPLVKLWRRARREKVLPNPEQLSQARGVVGWDHVSLDESSQTVELKRVGMRLDFGGIAKGFIAEEMSRVLKEQGFKQTLVAVAGDIVAGDAPTNAQGWKIGVAPLEASKGAASRFVFLKNCAISTSGDAFQFVEIEGKRYSHIVDIQTGMGLTRRSSVSVIAPDGTTADALATAVCILGPEPGLKFIESQQNIEALIVQATDDGVQVVESKGFQKYESK